MGEESEAAALPASSHTGAQCCACNPCVACEAAICPVLLEELNCVALRYQRMGRSLCKCGTRQQLKLVLL